LVPSNSFLQQPFRGELRPAARLFHHAAALPLGGLPCCGPCSCGSRLFTLARSTRTPVTRGYRRLSSLPPLFGFGLSVVLAFWSSPRPSLCVRSSCCLLQLLRALLVTAKAAAIPLLSEIRYHFRLNGLRIRLHLSELRVQRPTPHCEILQRKYLSQGGLQV